MAIQPKLGTILGEHGETLSRPQDALEDLNLPPGVQALVETRINAAIEQLREDNRFEIRGLIARHTRRWQIIAALFFLLNVASWFVAPQQIKKWAKDYVQQRMTAPELKKAADEAIKTQMADYVHSQIEPVRKDISGKQDELGAAQISINGQVKIQQLAIAAKAGGLEEFEELRKQANVDNSDTSAAAKTALKEVELFFDSDRGQLTYPTFVDSVSHQPPGWSNEEMLRRLEQQDSRAREAAVNVIASVAGSNKSKGIVEELIELLKRESDLRVIARISRALSIITKEEFKPLDREAILNWWRLHEQDPVYRSPFNGLKQALVLLDKEDNAQQLAEALVLLDQTLKADPDAIYTRCLKFRCLIARENLIGAATELGEIEKRQGDFRWALLWKSLLLHRQNKTEEAVAAINAAFSRSPELVQFAKNDPAFKDILTNPKITLPEKGQL